MSLKHSKQLLDIWLREKIDSIHPTLQVSNCFLISLLHTACNLVTLLFHHEKHCPVVWGNIGISHIVNLFRYVFFPVSIPSLYSASSTGFNFSRAQRSRCLSATVFALALELKKTDNCDSVTKNVIPSQKICNSVTPVMANIY